MGIHKLGDGRMFDDYNAQPDTTWCVCRHCGHEWLELAVAHATLCFDCEEAQRAEQAKEEGEE